MESFQKHLEKKISEMDYRSKSWHWSSHENEHFKYNVDIVCDAADALISGGNNTKMVKREGNVKG